MIVLVAIPDILLNMYPILTRQKTLERHQSQLSIGVGPVKLGYILRNIFGIAMTTVILISLIAILLF